MLNMLDQRQLSTHVPAAGWLLILSNAVFLLVGGFVFLLLTGMGVAIQEPEAFGIMAIVGLIVAGLLTVMAVPGIVAGAGLLARKSWGRILAIVMGVLSLTNVPVGTLIGGYVIWVLLQEEAGEYFQQSNNGETALG